MNVTEPPRTSRSPAIGFATVTFPRYTCTLPGTGSSITASRPMMYVSFEKRRSLAPVGVTTRISTTTAASVVSGTTSFLNIDPPRRAPEQQEEDRIDREEEHEHDRSADRA